MGNLYSNNIPTESSLHIGGEHENHYIEFIEEFAKKHTKYRKGAYVCRDVLLKAFYTFCDFKGKPVQYVGFETTLKDISKATLRNINDKKYHVMLEHYKQGNIGSEYWNTIVVNVELSSYPSLDGLDGLEWSSERRKCICLLD